MTPPRVIVRDPISIRQAAITARGRVLASDWIDIDRQQFLTPTVSRWSVPIQPSELASLLKGHFPTGLDDAWFIYADGPDANGNAALHFHRSDTGKKFAEVTIDTGVAEQGGSISFTTITWDPIEEFRTDIGEHEAKLIVLLLCEEVLNVQISDKGF